jgi:hypothetical protein
MQVLDVPLDRVQFLNLALRRLLMHGSVGDASEKMFLYESSQCNAP